MNHEVFLNVSIIFFLNVVFCGSFFVILLHVLFEQCLNF